MKIFYIFKLKKDYIVEAKNKPYNLYLVFKTLLNHNKKDILPAFHLFNSICDSINIDFFNKYIYEMLYKEESYTKFKNTHMYNNYLTGEVSKMIIKKTYIHIKSDRYDNIFLNIIKNIKNMFIIDFNREYYVFIKSNNKIKK